MLASGRCQTWAISRPDLIIPSTSIARHSRVVVHHGQAFDLLTVRAGVVDKVVRPQFVSSHRRLRTRAICSHAFPRPLPGHLQSGLGPQPEILVGTHDMPQAFHEHVDPAISKTRICRSQARHGRQAACPGPTSATRSGATTGKWITAHTPCVVIARDSWRMPPGGAGRVRLPFFLRRFPS